MSLTWVRTGELIGARWSELNVEGGRWTILAERMKMRSVHIVPLAHQTKGFLRMLQTLTGHSEWLFPGDRNPTKSISNMTILKALVRMGGARAIAWLRLSIEEERPTLAAEPGDFSVLLTA